LKSLVKELDEKLATEFKVGLEKINKKFSEFFTAMFGGGSASLSLIKERKERNPTFLCLLLLTRKGRK
jgi:chromosome segregation ATPase